MSFEITRQELLKQANELLVKYNQTKDPEYKAQETRIRRIVADLITLAGLGSQNLQDVTDNGSTTTNAIDTGGITTDYVQLDLAATPTPTQGMMFWDVDRSTVDLQLDADVSAKLGQDNFWYVKNQTGFLIPKGTVVMAVGALGASSRILVGPMVADGSVDAKYLLGITAEDILNGNDGFVTNIGKIRGIDTSIYTAGDILYCDPATPGGLTNVQPEAPDLNIPIAFAVDSKSNGTLAIRTLPGYKIDELHDVYINGITDGSILRYDAVNGYWYNYSGWSGNVPVGAVTLTFENGILTNVA